MTLKDLIKSEDNKFSIPRHGVELMNNSIYLISKGVVMPEMINNNGDIAVTGVYKSGEILVGNMEGSDSFMFYELPQIKAKSEVKGYALDEEQLYNLIATHPEAGVELLESFFANINQQREILRIARLDTADEKIIGALNFLYDRLGTEALEYKFLQQDIGNIAGTARETVSRTLHDPEHANLVGKYSNLIR